MGGKKTIKDNVTLRGGFIHGDDQSNNATQYSQPLSYSMNNKNDSNSWGHYLQRPIDNNNNKNALYSTNKGGYGPNHIIQSLNGNFDEQKTDFPVLNNTIDIEYIKQNQEQQQNQIKDLQTQLYQTTKTHGQDIQDLRDKYDQNLSRQVEQIVTRVLALKIEDSKQES